MNIKALVVAVVTALSSLGASAVVFSLYQTQDAIGITSSTVDAADTETSAMLLAGLMMMVTIARRRNAAKR